MENIPNKSILVTMDVRFLYTKMDGIKAMETTLKRKNLGTRIISTFLRLVLRLNNLIFKGCAMVTK